MNREGPHSAVRLRADREEGGKKRGRERERGDCLKESFLGEGGEKKRKREREREREKEEGREGRACKPVWPLAEPPRGSGALALARSKAEGRSFAALTAKSLRWCSFALAGLYTDLYSMEPGLETRDATNHRRPTSPKRARSVRVRILVLYYTGGTC